MMAVKPIPEGYHSVTPYLIVKGAAELKPVEDQFYGDRTGTLKDPFGHVWSIGTHIEDVPPAEMQKRMAKMMEGQGG
jgi:PhnB protein